MKLHWSNFIASHPDNSNLQDSAPEFMNVLAYIQNKSDRIQALSTLYSCNPTVVITSNPFDNSISCTFLHTHASYTMRGRSPSHSLALSGFGSTAIPVLLNSVDLTSESNIEVITPTLAQFMSSTSTSDQLTYLQAIKMDEEDTDPTPVRLAAVLPPNLSIAISKLQTPTPWEVLCEAINVISKTASDESGVNLTLADPYFEILRTLWVFCNLEEYEEFQPALSVGTPQTAATSESHLNWSANMHATHLNQQPASSPSLSAHDIATRIAASINQSNNIDRFAKSPEEDDDDDDDEIESKAWKKFDKVFKKAHLFACTTDGETVPDKPPQRFLQLLSCKAAPVAIRLFQTWHHSLSMVVLPGMVSNITKGIFVSFPRPSDVDTFSIFFCPPMAAGFKNLTNDELNGLDLSTSSLNLSASDIKKLTSCKPFVPPASILGYNLLKKQVANFHAVLEDCFGYRAIITNMVKDAWDHMNENDSIYEQAIIDNNHFPAWFLHDIHFKIQSVLHKCARSENITDVQFDLYSLNPTLRSISNGSANIVAPKWFLDQEKAQLEAQAKQDNKQSHHSGGGSSKSPYRGRKGRNDEAKRARIENPHLDAVVALKPTENYSNIINWQNLKKFENLAVKIEGMYMCNNYHMRGHCHSACKRSVTHVKPTVEVRGKYRRYCAALRGGLTDFKTQKDTRTQSSNGNTEAKSTPLTPQRLKIPNSRCFINPKMKTSTAHSSPIHAKTNNPLRTPSPQNKTSPENFTAPPPLPSTPRNALGKSILSQEKFQTHPPPLVQHPSIPPPDIPTVIKSILSTPIQPLQPHRFKFERSSQAATYNSLLIQQDNCDLAKALHSNSPNTILSYGAEFRPSSTLEPLLQRHPNWSKVKDIIDDGVKYPLEPIDNKQRIEDIRDRLRKGNHKSAMTPDNAKALHEAFDKEVHYQWALPIIPELIELLPDACLVPLGVAVQFTIDELNNPKIKRRVTHNPSAIGASSKTSPNGRVIKDLLEPCEYGHAFRRFIHGIHELRRRYPDKIIWMNKTDMEAAYRRIHAHLSAAVSCISAVDDIAYLLLRLPFGSTPAPAKFSLVSDLIGDLAHDLALSPSWDPSELHSSFDLNFPPHKLDKNVQFAKADPLAVALPPRDIISDDFIDDFIQACIDTHDNPARIKHAVPLALETVFRPIQSDDACPRKPIINMKKHQAEGRLEERKIVLGWLIDSRRFRVYLTDLKAKNWLHDVDNTIKSGKCTKKTLESLIGRFNHTSYVIHLGRYFLTRLRFRLKQYYHHHNSHLIPLAPWDIEDLKLWRFFIKYLTSIGASINNITYTAPSCTSYSDACEWGIGGFTSLGLAWRFHIPVQLQLRASINFLEFLAAVVTIQLSLELETHHTQSPHILAFTDNSSALGWLYHSTFNPVQHTQHDKLARYLARILFKHGANLFSEHIPGRENIIADSLSRDLHLSDADLTSLFFSSPITSPQVPTTFNIISLPPTISSWIVSTLQSIPPSTRLTPPTQTPSSLAASPGTKISSEKPTSPTPSLTPTQPPKNTSSSPPSLTASDTTTTKLQQNKPSKETPSAPPYQMWFRHSGKISGKTH